MVKRLSLVLVAVVWLGACGSGDTGNSTDSDTQDTPTTAVEDVLPTAPPATTTTAKPYTPATARPFVAPAPTQRSAYYANCDEARAAGAAPLHRGDPGYRPGLDRDNDGIACE
ncbi:MAG: hypothetical protein QOK28_2001 [Actinomycetota bacterium]|jgi:hypothetical protein